MNLKETYNRIAEEWHKDHQADDWWVEGTDALIALLPAGADVLDVGCGGGTKTKYLMEKGLRVTGIDFSEKMIEISRREVPTATFHVHDIRQSEPIPGTYDAIFAQAVLLHIPKAEMSQVLTRLADATKSGGYLYVAVKGKRPNGPDEETVEENDYGYSYQRFFSFFTQEEVESLLRNAGYEIIKSGQYPPDSPKPWVQVIGRKRDA